MTPVELSRTVRHAVRRAVDDGELSVIVPDRVVVERPRPGGCGDYATGVALQLARPAGRPPKQVAEVLRRLLLTAPGIAGIEITGPGFLNISLDEQGQVAALVREISRRGRAYGYPQPQPQPGDGVRGAAHSAAPLVLRVASGVRAAVVADSVALILRSQGVSVRLRYEDPAGPDPAWAALGAGVGVEVGVGEGCRLDCAGSALDHGTVALIRPAPAPASADPLPLGRDAGRWALLLPAAHDRPRIGAEHLAQREDNPLFRVQYAHARTRALLRNAADLGFTPAPGELALTSTATRQAVTRDPGMIVSSGAFPETATPATGAASTDRRAPGTQVAALTPAITPLTTALADYPVVLAAAARHRAPDRIARHLIHTGDAFLRYQEVVPILPRGDEKPSAAHRARLALAEAAGTVLAGGLALLGVDAPEYI